MDENMRCALYRCYAKGGKLLYVGVAVNPLRRQHNHTGTPWQQDCIKITLEWFISKSAAHRAEKVAIETERPKYNITHKARATVAWDEHTKKWIRTEGCGD